MNWRTVAILFAVNLYLSCAGWSHADTPIRSTPVAAEALTTATISVRNVRAGTMAWWIDPEHQVVPPEYSSARKADEQWFGSSPVWPPVPVALDGILKVVAHDDKQVIEVTGTEQGLRALRTEIEKLDKPLRQLELESQFVILDKVHVEQFGIDYLPGTPTSGQNVGRVRGNFAAILHKLQEKDIRVIQAPRVTVLNGLTAAMSFDTSEPLERHPNLSLITSLGLVCNATIKSRHEIDLRVAQPIQWGLHVATSQLPVRSNTDEVKNPLLPATGATELARHPNTVALTRPALTALSQQLRFQTVIQL